MTKIQEEWKQLNGKYKCPLCDREFSKKGIGGHIWWNHTKAGQIQKETVLTDMSEVRKCIKCAQGSWNKGLTKETDIRVHNHSKSVINSYKSGKSKPYWEGKKHTKETKKRISGARIKYLEEHPEVLPQMLSHSSKMSYPEKTFIRSLEENNITGWQYNYYKGRFCYDFAFVDLELDVEIDGGTHLREEVQKIDRRRDAWTKSQGWEVLRFTAKEVKRDVQDVIRRLVLKLSALRFQRREKICLNL